MSDLGRMEPNIKGGLPYLGGYRWLDITRDERFFCAELYFALSHMGRSADFIACLNKHNPKLKLPVDNEWQVGYEVVFYRDMIKKLGVYSEQQKKVTYKVSETEFSRKRTFDLTLFHPKHIVIIEAKAYQGLTTTQVTSFLKDKEMIRKLLDKLPIEKPEVHLVLLCTEHYKSSKRAKHIPEFDCLITWKDLAKSAKLWGTTENTIACFERADEQMGGSRLELL